MTNLDVTPVGGQAGDAVGRPTGAPSGGRTDRPDPFGSRPSVRRRGWVRLALGVVLLLGGVVATGAGILEAVDTYGKIEDDAVARGVIQDGRAAQALEFTVPDGGKRDYTVYLIFDDGNYVNRELEEDAAVRSTVCQATRADETSASFTGSRQGASVRIERSASIGHFAAVPGSVRVGCAYGPSSRRSERRRPDRVDYVVTPGKPSVAGGGTLLIVGGVFGAIGGGFLFAWGWRGSRRPV